jgi:hypothetical protein
VLSLPRRWLFNDTWATYDQIRNLDKGGGLGASSEVVCLVGYLRKQVPCPNDECFMPVYVRPATSDTLVLGQMYETVELDFVEPHSPKTILDGGANIGLASQIFGYM